MSFPQSAPVLPDVRRGLAVFAHPDDVDLGCAATITGWVDEGIEVGSLIITRVTRAISTTSREPKCPVCAWRNSESLAKAMGGPTV
ncbi:PIG-L family deacetylase [Micromonospora sp. NPDC005173]|uniref:PIG-L deacetylase family protein n=1 Tax=Micromonospora sp. NPDC005173 TaxID=3157165 RepID=UPI0033A8EB3A